MSRTRSKLYEAARLLGDVEAAERGPVPLGKRLVRRQVYRHVNRGTRAALRLFGLSR